MGPVGGQAARSVDHALSTIASVSVQLAQVEHRRKTVVYIGDSMLFGAGLEGAHPIRVPDAIRAASRADVSVDVIDAEGLRAIEAGAPPARILGSGAIEIASSTGGLAFINSNRFDRSVENVWQDSGHYYLLGYIAPTPNSEVHRITVRVKQSGVQVRARKYRR
jgi:VWFA-related protein